MNKSNYLLCKMFSVLLILVMVGCTSVQHQKQEAISTVSSSDGSLITFGVKGQGETTVVFVHCWTCSHKFWKPQIEYFSNKHKVVWLDLAGHGLSGSTRKEYKMSAFGEDVAAVVNNVGGNRVILVGHSMGGPVSIEAAKILGNKVVAVVGVDTFYTPFEYPKSEAGIEGFVKPFKNDFVGTSQQMVQSMFTPSVNPELKASIVKQFSGANQEMGVSAMYEIFRWSAQNVPSSLEGNYNRLKNIVSLNWIQAAIASNFKSVSYSASNIGLPVRI
ncbi:MAG: alpha/beta hydrolase, partial [Sedimenticola sp.]